MEKGVCVTILVTGLCLVPSAALGAPPDLVSPVGLVEQRCPTFSWSAVPGVPGYELVVYRVSDGVEQEPLLSARLPAGAAAWTPGTDCPTAGEQYAWTLRVLGQDGEESWSEPVLFEVSSAPSLGEVQAALATLRRYLAESRDGEAKELEAGGIDLPAGEARRSRRAPSAAKAGGAPVGGAVAAPEAGSGPDVVVAASVPTLGAPSLTVDANVALGADSNFFKDGAVFLWDDTTGNTAVGRQALASATGTAIRNTAVGREVLLNTVAGTYAEEGSANTGVGDLALRSNTTGYRNTATGFEALFSNTTGYLNTATGVGALRSNVDGYSNTATGVDALYSNLSGYRNTATGFEALRANTTGFTNTATGASALASNTVGFRNAAFGAGALQSNTEGTQNVAVGYDAGANATTGSDNIFILNEGVAGDSGRIRIGTQGTQNATFVAGIRGVTTANADAVNVVIDSAGQLGTTSSSRAVKQDIRDLGDLSERLLELRPVAFRYRRHVAEDPDTPLQFGLVAEQVAEVFPELVVRDAQGRPQTVKYHLLAALLLGELQRADRELAEQGSVLTWLQSRLTSIEGDALVPRSLTEGRLSCRER